MAQQILKDETWLLWLAFHRPPPPSVHEGGTDDEVLCHFFPMQEAMGKVAVFICFPGEGAEWKRLQ